jgi:hypothetical protein
MRSGRNHVWRDMMSADVQLASELSLPRDCDFEWVHDAFSYQWGSADKGALRC